MAVPHQAQIGDKTYLNWVRAVLGLKYTKEGIESFIDKEARVLHSSLLNQLGHPPQNCGQCTVDNLLPHHQSSCSRRTTCICSRGPKNLRRFCPISVCGTLFDTIVSEHRFKGPSWKNSDISQWVTDHWEVAKNFLPNTGGYKNIKSATDTDLRGLVNIGINMEKITRRHNFTVSSVYGPDDFVKCRTARNDILHNPSQSLSDVHLTHYLNVMKTTLQCTAALQNDAAAQQAVTILTQLDTSAFEITYEDITEVRRMALLAIQNEGSKQVEAIKEEGEKQKESVVFGSIQAENRALDNIGLESDRQRKMIKTEVEVYRRVAIENIEDKGNQQVEALNVVGGKQIKKVQNKGSGQVKAVMDEGKKQKQILKCEGSGQVDAIKVEGEKQKHSVVQAEKRALENIQDKVEAVNVAGEQQIENIQQAATIQSDARYQEEKYIDNDWILMLDETEDNQERMINSLLGEKNFPRKEHLSVILQRIGKNSSKFKKIIAAVSEHIHSLSGNILKVIACYKHDTDTDKPDDTDTIEVVFLVIYEGQIDSAVKEELKSLNTYCRIKNCVSEERKSVFLQKVYREETLTNDEEEKLKQTIARESNALFQKHSNITIISPSNIKSVGFRGKEHKMLNETCIVLCVPVKGLIPLFEEPFPAMIGDYRTDVMEGTFSFFGQTSKTMHSNIKTGCQITCGHLTDSNTLTEGTVGPFIQLTNGNVGFITSAHLVCNLKTIGYVNGKANISNLNLPVYQPDPTTDRQPIGSVRQILVKDGTVVGSESFEIAVVEILCRKPDAGTFPEKCDECFLYRNRKTKNGFCSCKTSYSGEFCRALDQVKKLTKVYMFGSQSGATKGFIIEKCSSVSIRFKKTDQPSWMLNQIEIVDNSQSDSLAQPGDSGSTVFVKKCNGDLEILGILVGGEPGIYYVTPISSIWDEIQWEPHTF